MTRAFKFVTFRNVEDYLRLGWMVSIPNAPMHHHHYGIELKWICDCFMPIFEVDPVTLEPKVYD